MRKEEGHRSQLEGCTSLRKGGDSAGCPSFPVTGHRNATKVKKEARRVMGGRHFPRGHHREVAAQKSFTGLKWSNVVDLSRNVYT